jgi:hypothetical protein
MLTDRHPHSCSRSQKRRAEGTAGSLLSMPSLGRSCQSAMALRYMRAPGADRLLTPRRREALIAAGMKSSVAGQADQAD